MPSACRHFALLQARLVELSQKFVADQVADEQANPVTFVPDLDRLAAYRLLVHAELEHFLEEKAKERLAAVVGMIASGSTWMRQYPGLISLAIELSKPLPQIGLVDTHGFSAYVNDLLAAARKRIGDNNGIKAPSFMFLSVCAGKAIDEIDIFLSGSLSSYGTERGDVAHQSITHSRSLQAPSIELRNAQALVQQLAIYFDVCP